MSESEEIEQPAGDEADQAVVASDVQPADLVDQVEKQLPQPAEMVDSADRADTQMPRPSEMVDEASFSRDDDGPTLTT
ncbi:hypothetical protein [Blastococcus goldschmidtiae]|uniref:Uncharacterized protein n=1 Tax=Blastococcus goldschmidtiae TaxID=3075546 RepID=A0ABU2K8Z8_9ACTN|nr:hypothetical protein [Blastococcus sp. DSM 46792]MDT0276651.1 hypothetical protein [Blastococcus sp. DSM 46792]